MRCDVLVVGAGYAGSILAERLATEHGLHVLVIDRRDHIGGNAHDYVDTHGIRVHSYGPHIFHTNSEKVRDYLSQFTDWRPYEHRVLAAVDGKLLPIPINRTTVNRLYGLSLVEEEEVAAFYAERAEPIEQIHTSEEAVVARVGRDLYEKFFRGYTRKQWELDPSELHASVTARIPARTNDDDRYFTDSFQAMPADGYTAMFKRMLRHDRIQVRLKTSFADIRDHLRWEHLVWTGPIDEYFDHCYGRLPYRSLRFETVTVDTPGAAFAQPVAQVNYPSDTVPYTRITEYRHFVGQRLDVSTVHYEYPTGDGPPYYPVPMPASRELYHRYEHLAAQEGSRVTFVGRLARYQYLNMDQAVAQALSTYERLAETRPWERVVVAA